MKPAVLRSTPEPTDDEPDERQESRDKRILTPNKLRESVRRDLSWLFNTGNLAATDDLENYPEVQRSTVNFGLPDLAGRTVSIGAGAHGVAATIDGTELIAALGATRADVTEPE